MNPVGWWEIYVDNLDQCVDFYERVLGIKLMPNEMEMPGLEMRMFPAEYERYGASGAICKMNGVKPGGNSTLVYFSCDDCAVPESRVVEAGGTVVQSKFSIGEHGWITMAQDPDGNTVGFHSLI